MSSWKHSPHTVVPCPWPLCGAVCRSAVCSPSVASLWHQRLWDTNRRKESKRRIALAKVQSDSASIPECHHQQEWDQHQVNLMVRNECRGLMVRLTSYFKQCWQLGGPTPELVLFPADGIDGEGVWILVAWGDDGPSQWEHPTWFLGSWLLIDKILQQARLIV